jgi:hypothetical protein
MAKRPPGRLGLLASLAVAASCGEEAKEEPFELEPPAPGHQIHLERQALEPDTDRTVCEERTLPNEQRAFVTRVELLATPALKRLEVYAVEEGSDAGVVDCPILPLAVMGNLARPIRMLYYGTPAAAKDEVRDDFRLPDDAAMPIRASQVLLLRYAIVSDAKPEDFELFLNLPTVVEPDLVAGPYTFSLDDFTIAPMVNRSFSTACDFVRDTTVLTVAAHQHSYEIDGFRTGAGTGVTVEHDGQTLLEGAAGPWALLPPLVVLANDGLGFTCFYDNRTNDVVGHGTTKYDEMCRVFGWAYPAPDGAILGSTMPDGGQYLCSVIDSVD